jgi:hypothetical protein
VPTGQAFQPLVMRVTDGSVAANPVMGVNVNFATTLARVSPDQGGQPDGDSVVGGDGVPVLLGSSQVQVVSTQDGLASMVPSAGNVGPCDVFITVSAGQSTTQLQMESVAAIVPDQPKNIGAQAPIARRGPQFGSQTSAPQSAAAALFAVPEGDPSTYSVPDLPVNTCPEAPADDASSDHGSSATSTAVVNEKAVSAPCPRSKPPEAIDPKKDPKKEMRTESDVAPTKPPSPAETQPNPASSSWLSEDKRSCRVLAGDGRLP